MKLARALVLLAAAAAAGFAASFSAGAATSTPLVRISGTVRDLLDRPVPGAVVAVVDGEAARRARADGRGHFVVATPPGDYAVTATAPWDAAGSVAPVSVVTDAVIDVRVGGNGCILSGRVRDDSGAPAAGVPLRFARHGGGGGSVFLAESDADGRYRVVLPAASGYEVGTDDAAYLAQPVTVEGAPARVLDLLVVRARPAPDDVVRWIQKSAQALSTVEPGHGSADLEPLREVLGEARVVGLGEATHGSRQFFQLKHRLLEFLVERMGFSLFGMEASWPGSLAVDDYVVSGRGDARAALAGMQLWSWNTEEVLAQVEWMRAYNADPGHPRKLRFYGFDRYRSSVDPRMPRALEGLLPWDGPERDRSMAEHVRLILEHQPAWTRMVLWAHNDHVSRASGGSQPMGAWLAEWLGREYVACGFLFGRGGFQAIDWTAGPQRPGTLVAHSVGAPPPDTVDAALSRAGLPRLALSLRPQGGRALPAWLLAPRRTRESGVAFSGEDTMPRTLVLPSAYDLLFFVEQTTAARPIVPPRRRTAAD